MNFANLGKISFIGDSLSLPGRTPGTIFCQWINQDTGNKVLINKQAVGGFALSYWRPLLARNKYGKKASSLTTQAMSTTPSIVFALLGMNDYAQSAKAIEEGIRALDAATSSKLFLIGPPQVGEWVREGTVRAGLDNMVKVASAVLGERFFDSRPITEDLTAKKDRPDGIHFAKGAAAAYGGRLYHALREDNRHVTLSTSIHPLVLGGGLWLGGKAIVALLGFAKNKRWL